jgi:hypothetical protein
MKSGTMNEDDVLNSISMHPCCKEVYECGLFSAKYTTCMGVSPDGISVMTKPPLAPVAGTPPLPGPEETFIASVEIKTRFAAHKRKDARDCAAEYGNGGIYFTCTVGDERWWRAVPAENRGQVLHQAAVLNLNHVLFCVSAADVQKGQLIMMCLVEVTDLQMATYELSIRKWKHLMDWAHECISTSGPPPKPHTAFTDEDSYIITSHLRLWRALRKLVRANNNLPIHPVYIVKCAAQVLYNKLKGGIDGSTQYVRALTSLAKPEIQTNMEQKLVLRTLKQITVNAGLLFRIRKVQADPTLRNWTAITDFRRHVNAQESIPAFAHELSLELLEYAGTLTNVVEEEAIVAGPGGNMPPPTLSAEEIADALKSLRKKRNLAIPQLNTGVHKQMRLMLHHQHNKAVRIGTKVVKTGQNTGKRVPLQKRCVMCSGQSSFKCALCGVVLHYTSCNGANNASRTCADRFHTNSVLQE